MLNFSNHYLSSIETLKSTYFEFFKERGYRPWLSSPLITEDPSLLFTNAFIVALKTPLLESYDEMPEKLVMEQACIRLQNLKGSVTSKNTPAYRSVFEMIGGFIKNQHIEDMIKDLHSWFLTLDPNLQNWKLRYSKTQLSKELIRAIEGQWPLAQLICDDQPESYYQWKYGNERLTGRGLTFKYDGDQPSLGGDFGNIVELFKDGVSIGYEFGFGLETLIARFLGKESVLEIASLVDQNPFWAEKDNLFIQDHIYLAAQLGTLKIDVGDSGRHYIFKKILKNLGYFIATEQLSLAKLVSAFAYLKKNDPSYKTLDFHHILAKVNHFAIRACEKLEDTKPSFSLIPQRVYEDLSLSQIPFAAWKNPDLFVWPQSYSPPTGYQFWWYNKPYLTENGIDPDFRAALSQSVEGLFSEKAKLTQAYWLHQMTLLIRDFIRLSGDDRPFMSLRTVDDNYIEKNTNSVSKCFHRDTTALTLFVTFTGKGVEYLEDEGSLREALKEEPILSDATFESIYKKSVQIKEVPFETIGILKGELPIHRLTESQKEFLGHFRQISELKEYNTDKGLLHRGPPLGENSGPRLVLTLSSFLFPQMIANAKELQHEYA